MKTYVHLCVFLVHSVQSFTSRPVRHSIFRSPSCLHARDDDEAEELKKKAEMLREQIREMEEQLGDRRRDSVDRKSIEETELETESGSPSLKGKRVLVTGANGRLGSMVCRYLLRNYPETEVVAAVHYVGENSPTSRGYARLSYEVGAEDGVGSIGPAWSSEDRTATFEFDTEVMSGHNLNNLRIVECELLDPLQCQTIVEDSRCDAIVWCATDFNGNQPRAVASLDVALLFRAVSRPTKGRVEVEGLQNMLNAFKLAKGNARWNSQRSTLSESPEENISLSKDMADFVLVSVTPEAFLEFETPFGSFTGIKQQGENILRKDFPSLSYTVLQFGRFDDNFVQEGLKPKFEDISSEQSTSTSPDEKERRRINRRDAAKFAAEAILKQEIQGKTVQVWTDPQ